MFVSNNSLMQQANYKRNHEKKTLLIVIVKYIYFVIYPIN